MRISVCSVFCGLRWSIVPGMVLALLPSGFAAEPMELPGLAAVEIRNPSFEEAMAEGVPKGWRAYKRASATRRRELVKTAAGVGLALIDEDTAEEIGVQQTFSAQPSMFYQVTARVRAMPERDFRNFYLQLRFLPSNKRSQVALTAGSATEAVVNSVSGVSPAGTTDARIYIYSSRSTTPAIMIDEVSVETAPVRMFDSIEAPVERVPETVLVQDGKGRCVIVAPEVPEWQALAGNLVEALGDRTGFRPDARSPADVTNEAMSKTTAIVLGNVCNNWALVYPYSHSLTFADEVVPGDSGFELRSVHNPWGTGHNMIVVGASDLPGGRKAVAALVAMLPTGKTLALPAFLETELTGRAKELWGNRFTMDLGEKWVGSQKRGTESSLARGIHGGLFSLARTLGQNYALTRRAPYAEMFVWLIRRAKEHHDSKPSTYGGPWGMDSDFRIYAVIPAWDAVEECPSLSDQDRLDVTKILFEWISDLDHKGVARGTSVRFNHTTFPALGCLHAGQYFAKHYDVLQAQLWIQQADTCFQFQAETTKPHCDCNSYQWLPIHHTMLYALTRADLRFFDSGNARCCADYVVINMNGLGLQVPYGDVGGWQCWGPAVPVLQMAQWYYRDPGLEWALQKKRERRDRVTLGGYNTRATGEARVPEELNGMTVWPVTEPWYRTFVREGDPDLARTVDKIAFRNGFGLDDQYLLLDGLARGGHGHMDANAILQWAENDRVWLADTDYIKSLPKFHNTLLIMRNGQSARIPGFCELRNAADLPGLSVSRTALSDYAGTDWERTIVWLKGRYFVVLDKVTALTDANYSIRAVWQTLGEATIDETHLDIKQKGQHAAITMAAGTRCMLHDDHEQGRNWEGYPHADPVVRVFQGMGGGQMRKGDSCYLATVLHASGETPSSVRVNRVGERLFTVTGEGEAVLLALPDSAGRIAVADAVEAEADLFVLTPRRGYGVNVRRVSSEQLTREFAESADLGVELRTGEAAIVSPARQTAADKVVWQQAELGAMAEPDEVDDLIRQFSPWTPARIAAEQLPSNLPALRKRWTRADFPKELMITANGNAFGSVDAGMRVTCRPDPLPANMFSGEAGANTPSNMFDNQLQGTGAATMWADDQEVTIDLAFDEVCSIERLSLDAWFATRSSKGKTFQLGRLQVLASKDGFAADTRVLVEQRDDKTYPSWGNPVNHTFDGLEADARSVRLVLTPRPGSAIYIAEIRLFAKGRWLSERFAAVGGGGNLFPAIEVTDVDGDGRAECLAGAASGALICWGADGQERWRADTGGALQAVSSIADGRTGRRVVVVGGKSATVYAYDHAGKALWTYDVETYKRKGIVRVIFPAGLDGNGQQVAIVGAENWRYYALDSTGEKRWHYESVHPSTAGLAVDLNGDGRQEAVLGTAYYWWPCVQPDGSKLWGYRTAGGPGANAVGAGDLDGDGKPEVVFGGADTFVQAAGNGGERLWQFNTGDEVTAVHCLDTDGNGTVEVLVTSLSFNAYCLNGAGELVWQRELGSPIVKATPVTFDERPALAAGCGNGSVVLLDVRTGRPLARGDAGAAVLDMKATGTTLAVSTSAGNFIVFDLVAR